LIGANQTTIASMLKAQGYRTAMVGKWHLGFEENGYDQPLPGGPVDVGFDMFFGIRASTDIPPYFYIRGNAAVSPPTKTIEANRTEGWSPIQGAFWRAGHIAPDMDLAEVLPRFTDEAIAVIQQHARLASPAASLQPLMLYLAFPAPHTPWLPSAEFRHTSQAGLYGDFTRMVDAMIGRVLAALEESGMSDETLVFFTSDNGPVWYDQDVSRWGHDSAGGLRGMKADAWEAGHRMPFIVRWPGRVAAGSVSHQTVCFTDLLATLATISGYQLEPDDGPDSFDMSGELLGSQPEGVPIRPSLVMQSGRGLMTVRQGAWKLIEGLGSGGFSDPARVEPTAGNPAGQLYNLQEDPGETNNLYLRHPDVVARLRETLRTVRQSGRSR
jgi:arylsulfatase A-like enzyme